MLATPTTRVGGPRNTRPHAQNNARTAPYSVSHMPLDTAIHWTLRNPLNIIPATLLVLTLIAIVSTLAYL